MHKFSSNLSKLALVCALPSPQQWLVGSLERQYNFHTLPMNSLRYLLYSNLILFFPLLSVVPPCVHEKTFVRTSPCSKGLSYGKEVHTKKSLISLHGVYFVRVYSPWCHCECLLLEQYKLEP